MSKTCFWTESRTTFIFNLEKSRLPRVSEKRESISKLAQLSDIFEELNFFNLIFQGPDNNVAGYISKITAFESELIWIFNL